MADNINPELEAALRAALDIVETQLRGLRDKENDAQSNDLRSDIQAAIEDRTEREVLLQALLDDLKQAQTDYDALVADGYPVLAQMPIPQSTFAELGREMADLEAAASVFSAIPQATSISIGIGAPTEGVTSAGPSSKKGP